MKLSKRHATSPKSARTASSRCNEIEEDDLLQSFQERIIRIVFSNQLGGWADQLVTSATNLLLILAVGRLGGLSELGYYALALSVSVILTGMQDALVTRPYTVQILDGDRDPRSRARAALRLAVYLSLIFTSIALLAALVALFTMNSRIFPIFVSFAATLPLILLREFARRYSFANMKAWDAFWIDAASAAATLLTLALFSAIGPIMAVHALLATAIGAALSTGPWILLRRRDFCAASEGTRGELANLFGMGRWLAVGQLAAQAQGYALHWVTLIAGGAFTTGVYSASVSVVSLSNPFLFGYFNLLTPQYVRVYKKGSSKELVRSCLQSSIFLGAVMGVFTGLIWFGGEILFLWMFGGIPTDNIRFIVTTLAIAATASAIGGPAAIGLMVTGHAKATSAISAAVCIFAASSAFGLMKFGGLESAVYGLLAAECAGTLARWCLLFYTVTWNSLISNEKTSNAAHPRRL